MKLYPMTFKVGSSRGEIRTTIDYDGWTFQQGGDRIRFQLLPVAERLDLRRVFEAQVRLAKDTKGAAA
jgi:hypothetical protein